MLGRNLDIVTARMEELEEELCKERDAQVAVAVVVVVMVVLAVSVLV